MTMRERQDLRNRILFPVNYGERKPLQHIPACVVLAYRPPPRRFDHQGYSAIDLSNKFLSGRLTPLQIPLHGRFQFLKGGGMNLDPLSSHCLPAMKDGGDLLARFRPGHRSYFARI